MTILDNTLSKGISADSISVFMTDIETVRESLSDNEWKRFTTTNNDLKRMRYLLCHDPYTRWGLLKPRGYAGDATLMDFAYRHTSINDSIQQSGQLGNDIYLQTSAALQSKSARERTKLIADEITAATSLKSNLRIASFASGHGREIEYLSPTTISKISEFLAIDTDKNSLSEIKKYQTVPLVSIKNNVFKMKSKQHSSYNFVYSLGLFDYLNEKSATKLLNLMWQFTDSGGRLIIANLNKNAANLGYCEAIMDWWMITRTEAELLSLAGEIKTTNESNAISVKTVGCFSYLTLDKK